MIILSPKAKKVVATSAWILVALIAGSIFFSAGVIFNTMQHPVRDITVKELAFEIKKGADFSLNIDSEWQLSFENKQGKWQIEKRRRTKWKTSSG